MTRLLPLALLLPALCASASSFFVSTVIDATNEKLMIVRADGQGVEAPRINEQVGFENPVVAPGGQYVGWLAMHPNCCTSYPVPRTLVVSGQDGRLREFRGPQAIDGWCFVPTGKAVAYRQAALHGPADQTFELRRITDGKLLKRFVRRWDQQANEPSNAKVPSWAECAAS